MGHKSQNITIKLMVKGTSFQHWRQQQQLPPLQHLSLDLLDLSPLVEIGPIAANL